MGKQASYSCQQMEVEDSVSFTIMKEAESVLGDISSQDLIYGNFMLEISHF